MAKMNNTQTSKQVTDCDLPLSAVETRILTIRAIKLSWIKI